jgi:nitroreductase/NAD-dependent dihydropyrimidine dehydrogenase PreA subunit
MSLIKVDPKFCIKCGICVNVCPIRVLSMGDDYPVEINPQACIACGHCVAACPREALDNIKTPLCKQEVIAKFPALDAETAEVFLRSRRSIRCYKDSKVPREKLVQLVNIARFAQTGSNRQGVSYIIIENKDILKTATRLVIEWMESYGKKSAPSSFPLHVKTYKETGTDPILRDAPHLILGMTDKNIGRGRENTVLSFAYLELFAPSLELGTCWAGLLELAVFADYQPLLKLFALPEGKKFTGAMMVGYPKYTYKRLVDRNPLDITWMT